MNHPPFVSRSSVISRPGMCDFFPTSQKSMVFSLEPFAIKGPTASKSIHCAMVAKVGTHREENRI